MKRLTALVLFALALFGASAFGAEPSWPKGALTEEGERVLLNEDGTWTNAPAEEEAKRPLSEPSCGAFDTIDYGTGEVHCFDRAIWGDPDQTGNEYLFTGALEYSWAKLFAEPGIAMNIAGNDEVVRTVLEANLEAVPGSTIVRFGHYTGPYAVEGDLVYDYTVKMLGADLRFLASFRAGADATYSIYTWSFVSKMDAAREEAMARFCQGFNKAPGQGAP